MSADSPSHHALGRHPRGRDGLVFRPVGEEWVVWDPEQDELHVLNLTSAMIWRLCDGTASVEAMVEALADTLPDAPGPAAIEVAVRETVARFEALGLLE